MTGTPTDRGAPANRMGTGSSKGPRATNQDAVLATALGPDAALVALADGMGGLEAGERSARTAVRAFHRAVEEGLDPRRAVARANEAVLQAADGASTGTTLVAAVVREGHATVVNVGDSRAWHRSRLGLACLTRDHTLEADEAETADPRERAAVAGTRWGSTLTRSLGGSPRVDADLFGPVALESGDDILLTSDGVHQVLSPEEITAILRGHPDPEAAARALVDRAVEAGTGDNASAAVLSRSGRPRESRPASSPPRAWDPAQLVRLSRRRTDRRGRWARVMLFLVAVAAAVALVWVLAP
jgi:protein phosphatase